MVWTKLCIIVTLHRCNLCTILQCILTPRLFAVVHLCNNLFLFMLINSDSPNMCGLAVILRRVAYSYSKCRRYFQLACFNPKHIKACLGSSQLQRILYLNPQCWHEVFQGLWRAGRYVFCALIVITLEKVVFTYKKLASWHLIKQFLNIDEDEWYKVWHPTLSCMLQRVTTV